MIIFSLFLTSFEKNETIEHFLLNFIYIYSPRNKFSNIWGVSLNFFSLSQILSEPQFNNLI